MQGKLKGLIAAALILGSAAAWSQSYPVKPVRIVVPFAPGGNVDINARAIAPGLNEIFGQQVLVENRAGAGGMIGGEFVARAPADGYTLLMASNSVYSVAPNVFSKPRYHPVKDFAAISGISNVPFVIVLHPSVPARNLKEFIALVKSRPGQMTMATAGTGTSNHLVGELFQISAGVRMTGVPYKGSGPALIDLIGGQVDSHVDQLTASMAYIQSGRIRALAVTTDQRAPLLPNVPTLAEQGLKGFDATTITGLLAPAGTPKEVIDRVHAAVVKVTAQQAIRDRFAALGATTLGNSPAEFADYIRQDYARWQKVVAAANIRAE
ncbi:MAG: tripartite tricarboxylate transporter substrate binding protein [Betaproteobacteria bacterium]|nr:tripartite tricarboxylate transporter substrate binding protein [Betaproteobacteria bacterium]